MQERPAGLGSEEWFELHGDERLEWWSRPTILTYLPRMGALAALIVVSIAGVLSGFPGLPYVNYFYGIVAGLSAVLLVYYLLKWRNIYYVVTDRRVIRKHGIFSREVNPANFSRISNIKVDVSLVEKALNLVVSDDIGDIFIHTADDDLPGIVFRNVTGVDEARRRIQSNLNGSAGEAYR